MSASARHSSFPFALSCSHILTLSVPHHSKPCTHQDTFGVSISSDSLKMSNEEEQYDDSTMGGPGAPTPVSALEVGFQTLGTLAGR